MKATTSLEQPTTLDERTLKARRWTSDFCAAFNATLKAAGFSDDVRKPLMAVMDAAALADNKRTRVRYFPCVDWLMGLYFRRGPIPPDLSEEELARFKHALARSWKRSGWSPLHAEQCRTHLGFIVRRPGQIVNNTRKASVYEDRLTDLVTKVMLRARKLRARRIDRFDRAAVECLEEFRNEYPAYAPDWQPEEKGREERTASATSKTTRRQSPSTRTRPAGQASRAEAATDDNTAEDAQPGPNSALEAFRLEVKALREQARGLSEDESDALRMRLHTLIEDIWTDAPDDSDGDPNMSVPPVCIYEVDTHQPEARLTASRGGELRAATFSAKRKKAEQNEEISQNDVDNLSTSHQLPTASPTMVTASDESEAELSVTAFASVGAVTFEVTLIDETKPRGAPAALFETVDETGMRKHLPRYLERNRTRPESLTVRPRCLHRIIQVDDCNEDVLRRLEPFCFLQELTSPSNGQSWIALAGEMDDEAYRALRSRLLAKLKPTGANGGAYGSTRWPGSLNKKPERCYADGTSPLVRLLIAAPGRTTTPAELERAGLLTPPPRPRAERAQFSTSKLPDSWPDYDEELRRADRTDTDRPDRSNADIRWSIKALRGGWPRHSTITRLSSVSPKAKTRRDNYAERTVDAAARILSSNV